MLEIGAGAGYFLDEAKKLGFDVSGIEVNKTLAEFMRSELGISCEEYPISVSSFEGKKFDIIYHCDVISHLHDPIAEFEKINGKLKKGGFVVFETGNGGDIDKKYFKYFASFGYPDHLFFFSTANLKELLLRTGFDLISIYRFSILAKLISLAYARNYFILATSDTTEKLEIRNEIEVKSFLRRMLKDFYSCFSFLMSYTLGYLLPKGDRPQTTIIVARKK